MCWTLSPSPADLQQKQKCGLCGFCQKCPWMQHTVTGSQMLLGTDQTLHQGRTLFLGEAGCSPMLSCRQYGRPMLYRQPEQHCCCTQTGAHTHTHTEKCRQACRHHHRYGHRHGHMQPYVAKLLIWVICLTAVVIIMCCHSTVLHSLMSPNPCKAYQFYIRISLTVLTYRRQWHDKQGISTQ